MVNGVDLFKLFLHCALHCFLFLFNGDDIMRRQSLILTFFLTFSFVVLSLIQAQEPGDIVAFDSNAGIMTRAAGKIAYSRLSDLIIAELGKSYYTTETSTTYPAQTYAYILRDIEDDATGDVWLFSGCVLTYDSSSSCWRKLELDASLYAVNGKWALGASGVTIGLPGMKFSNFYGLTYLEVATYFEICVAAERKFCELCGKTFNEAFYFNYINCNSWDTDGGGVNNIAEWVRGTAIDDWTDDKPSGNACMCGACCGCECKCGKWDGPKCAGSTGAGGCDCHKDDDPEEECSCSKYCCYHTCECKRCASLPSEKHSQHKNGSPTCTGSTGAGGCDCHKDDDPEEECSCSKYCCYHTCECKRCASLPSEKHSQHKNGSTTCTGSTGAGGCDCHKDKNPEEECACSKYCCYHTCECKRCASLPAEKHSQHKNGSTTCTGSTGEGGCDCHKTATDDFDVPEEREFKVPEDEKNKNFIDASGKFRPSIERFENAFESKYGVKNVMKYFKGDFSGALPSWEFELPGDWGVARIDFGELEDYDKELTLVRSVLVTLVYLLTASYVLRSLRELV